MEAQSYHIEVYPELFLGSAKQAIIKDKEHRGHKAHNNLMPYGQGCPLHSSCFTCPVEDCVWEKGINKKKEQELIERWKPIFARAGIEEGRLI